MRKLLIMILCCMLLVGCKDSSVKLEEKNNVNNIQEETSEVKVITSYKEEVTSDLDDVKVEEMGDGVSPDALGIKKVYMVSGSDVFLPEDKIAIWHLNVKIPKIDSDKKKANDINRRIQDKYQLFVDIAHNGVQDYISGIIADLDINYETYELDDYLIINVKKQLKVYKGSTELNIDTYIYDKNNDQEITKEVFLNNYGITKDKVLEQFLSGNVYYGDKSDTKIDYFLQNNPYFESTVKNEFPQYFSIIVDNNQMYITYNNTIDRPTVHIPF